MASLFTSGLSGLFASQRSLTTTGHNIANVNTPGYSRQRVEVASRAGHADALGFNGAGVAVKSVERMVDAFSTQQIRSSTAGSFESERLYQLASQVDNILADPDGGLSPAVQSFFDAVQGLAADPSSVASRQVALAEARGLVQRFMSLDTRLADIEQEMEERLGNLVGDVNTLSAGVAQLNLRIFVAEGAANGNPANDLRDQRDELVRQMSERMSVSTTTQVDGAINVYMTSGQPLVVGHQAVDLMLSPNAYDPGVSEIAVDVGGTPMVVTSLVGGGEIGGVVQFRDEILAPAFRAIGRVAIGLAKSFNDQHQLGMDLMGASGGDFFNHVENTAPGVLAHAQNAGAAVITAQVSDVSALESGDYRLDRSGATYSLTRLSDGAVTALTSFPAGPETVDGVTLSLASGVIADGDSFLMQPTRRGAAAIDLAITAPTEVAAASPVKGAAALANTGSGVFSAPRVNSPNDALTYTFTSPTTFDVVDQTTGATLAAGVTYVPGNPVAFNGATISVSGAPAAGDVFRMDAGLSSADAANTGTGAISDAAIAAPDPNLTDSVTITFTSPTTFDVAGATTGSPTTGITYVAGSVISFNGWSAEIRGTPQTGDTFTVAANASGVGDNRNMLALADLQTTHVMDGGTATFQEVYAQLVGDVGTRTHLAEVNAAAQGALLAQARQSREAFSGVNLDEEAANLLRFQQAYQASARLISVADELFATLLSMAGR